MRSHLKAYSLPSMGWKFPPFWNIWHYKWLLSLSNIGVIIWKEVSLPPAWTGKCYMTNIPYISTSWCVSFVIQSVPQFYFWANWIKVEQVESSCVGFTLPTIVTWMIQNICKPTVQGPAGILCCGCQSDVKSWGFVWTCNCHRSKRMITKCLLFHIFTLLNIDCYINRHCIS